MDWKNEKNYPGLDASGEVWAWEFLRRNPKYRADYAKVSRFLDDELSDKRVLKVLDRYQTGALGNPDNPKERVFVAPPFELTQAMTFLGGRDFVPHVREGEAVFKFNVRYSLEDQLTHVKRELLRRRKALAVIGGRNRDSWKTYRRYLQILDGVEAGANNNELALTLYSSRGDAKKTLSVDKSRAAKLRDGGYLELLRP